MNDTTEKILREADKKGYVIRIGKRSIALRKKDGVYHLTVRQSGHKPLLWIYRRPKIASDRFEEQVAFYRKGKR